MRALGGGGSSASLTARPQRQRPPGRHRVIAERRGPEPNHVAAALQPARGAAPLHREQPGGHRGDGDGAGGTRGCRHLALGRAEGGRAWLRGGPGWVLRCP